MIDRAAGCAQGGQHGGDPTTTGLGQPDETVSGNETKKDHLNQASLISFFFYFLFFFSPRTRPRQQEQLVHRQAGQSRPKRNEAGVASADVTDGIGWSGGHLGNHSAARRSDLLTGSDEVEGKEGKGK